MRALWPFSRRLTYILYLISSIYTDNYLQYRFMHIIEKIAKKHRWTIFIQHNSTVSSEMFMTFQPETHLHLISSITYYIHLRIYFFFKSAKFINLQFFHPNPVRLNCINKSFMTLQPETHFHLISSITYYKAYHMEWKCVILKIGIDFRPRTNIFMELLLWLHK